MILGEAVNGLSDQTKARRADIPWREVAGLRDLLAHESYRIEISVIDDIVARDLTPLEAAVTQLRRPAAGD